MSDYQERIAKALGWPSSTVEYLSGFADSLRDHNYDEAMAVHDLANALSLLPAKIERALRAAGLAYDGTLRAALEAGIEELEKP